MIFEIWAGTNEAKCNFKLSSKIDLLMQRKEPVSRKLCQLRKLNIEHFFLQNTLPVQFDSWSIHASSYKVDQVAVGFVDAYTQENSSRQRPSG